MTGCFKPQRKKYSEAARSYVLEKISVCGCSLRQCSKNDYTCCAAGLRSFCTLLQSRESHSSSTSPNILAKSSSRSSRSCSTSSASVPWISPKPDTSATYIVFIQTLAGNEVMTLHMNISDTIRDLCKTIVSRGHATVLPYQLVLEEASGEANETLSEWASRALPNEATNLNVVLIESAVSPITRMVHNSLGNW